MFYAGNLHVVEPGIVFFSHMTLVNDDTGLTMSLGETSIVVPYGYEQVSYALRQLIIK